MRIVAAVIFGALLVVSPSAHGEPSLIAVPLSGSAPLSVTISGPEIVLERIAQCNSGDSMWFGLGGNGLTIEWGDGSEIFSYAEVFSSPASLDCAARQRRHVYSVPGSYRLAVWAWHPGPIDAPVTDWKGEATVAVGGTGPADSLEIVEPHDRRTYFYQRFPSVRWRSSVSEPSTMRVEVVNEAGSVLSSKDFAWASVGERDVSPILDYKAYDRALRNGQAAAFARVSLLRAGQVLLSRDGVPQQLSARIQDNQFFIHYRDDRADPYTATVRVNLLRQAGEHGRIEWGDGQTTDVTGPIDDRSNVFAHHYTQPGDYHIKFRTDAYSGDQDINEVVGYYGVDVRVPRTRVDRWPDTKRR